MDLNTSVLRDAMPDLSEISDASDNDSQVAGRSDRTLLSFLVSEVGGVASAAFNGYSTAFINNFLYAIIFAFACNYLWQLPLSQVVDVSLAFFLFVTGIMMALYVIRMGRVLAEGQFYLALYFALIAILSGLLPFASIFGFSVYGWFVEGDWTAASSVYQWYVGVFGSGYAWLEARVGDFLGLMVVETDAKGVDVSKVDNAVLAQWAQIVGAVAATLDLLLRLFGRTGASTAS